MIWQFIRFQSRKLARLSIVASITFVSCMTTQSLPAQPKPLGEQSATEAVPAQTTVGSITDANAKITETLEKMRDVTQRVQKKDTGQQTQTLQKQILANLDSLIQTVEQQQKQEQQQQNQQQQSQKNQQQQQRSQQQRKNKGRKQQNTQQPKPDGKRKKDGQESTTKTEEAAATAAVLAQRKIILKQAWGHLPERLRERVLNMSGDKYLPKYENLIRQYFEALAEKRTSPKDKR